MNEKIVYSPKLQKQEIGVNFKKSPNKFVCYDSPKEANPFPTSGERAYFAPSRDFNNLKKLPTDASSLRQTMNYGRLMKRHTCYDFEG